MKMSSIFLCLWLASRGPLRLFTVPYFSVRSQMLIVDFDGLPSWYLDASETRESTKCPLVGCWRAQGAEKIGRLKNWETYFFAPSSHTIKTPPPLPTSILYSPQFRSHQETKMATRRTQRSTSTILRENRGL